MPFHRVALLSAATSLLVAAACMPPAAPAGEGTGGAGQGTGAAAVEVLIEVAELDTATFEEQIVLYGETEPVRSATVSAQIGGRIVDLAMVEGETVAEGDTVMRLNASQGRAQIDRLDVVVSQLETEISRTQALIDRGLATQSTLDALEAERDANREAIAEVRAGVRETTHRAPISGEVSEVHYEVGEFAGQGNAVARIVDLSTIVVRAGLPEREISYVSVGQTVEVLIEATGERVEGRIHRIGLEANPRNRTFPLEIHVENGDGSIRGGMRATVTLLKRRLDDAVIIPRDSVLRTVSGSEVFVTDGALATARDIELGPSQGRFVVATAGLAPGELLVVRGHRALVTGTHVNVSRQTACCGEQYGEYLHGDPVAPDDGAEE
jgi:membrane fusion protein (multidrug efflux system)